ncbi:SDA1-domain-containing protein [Ceraceosorus guamensis]|uniref:Protein SDA1 n=1 Tax=Ceraceosorus guamensis TaxID=1522189 RepID=A0A316VZ94_9BASI|nr:SDA1-domain-containing protein [Ceraceosorus guamensis]PWN40815.1 SDA1-domain-containing protein [Ceraceosorus guamensis]
MVRKAMQPSSRSPHALPDWSEAHSTAGVVALAHSSKARGLLNVANLPALQNLVKRSPTAYADEFGAQWNHYQSMRMLYAANLGEGGAMSGAKIGKEQEDTFCALIGFITQLAPSFPEVTRNFPSDLSELLLNHHSKLGADVRHSAVRALVLLRNRDVITSEHLLRTLFPLLSQTTSATFRSLLQTTILADIKAQNKKAINHRHNRVVQGLLFSVIERGIPARDAPSEVWRKGAEAKGRSEALWATRLAADLWRKGIWTDAKTVSLLALACFHPHPKVQSSAVRFFLGDLHSAEDGGSEEESDDEPNVPDVSKMQHARKVNKKTRSGDKKVRAAAALARRRRKEHQDGRDEKAEGDGRANLAAVHMLNDPQGFGEKLFESLSRGDKRINIELKVRMMQLLARVMGAHRLSVLPFYSYIVKYLNPHQLYITLILVSLAQSVHLQTPPDALTPVLRKLADGFVHPGVGPEVVAAGINAIRETCRRQPEAIESDLLQDLIGYKKSKDKGVSAASRGLLLFYREVNPALLPRSERGKSGALSLASGKQARMFGEEDATTRGIPGIELLEQHLAEQEAAAVPLTEAELEEADKKAWEGWEAESDSDSDDSGGWIAVSSDEDGEGAFDVSGSEDESDKTKGGAAEESKSIKERLAERREKTRAARRKLADKSEHLGTDSDAEEGDDQDDVEVAPRESAAEQAEQFSKLATTRILTPADFAKLAELRLKAAEEAAASGKKGSAAAKREIAELKAASKRTATQASSAGSAVDTTNTMLSEMDILGPRKKRKADYEERMASIAEGREGREKFGSKKGKKTKHSSTTNEQKAKKGKNFNMIAKSFSVRNKAKTSLREKSKKLKQHVETQKKRKGMK